MNGHMTSIPPLFLVSKCQSQSSTHTFQNSPFLPSAKTIFQRDWAANYSHSDWRMNHTKLVPVSPIKNTTRRDEKETPTSRKRAEVEEKMQKELESADIHWLENDHYNTAES